MSPAAFDRAQALERLRTESFDVLVVGGGVTGAGVALDAASRGLKTALVERRDFATGTSSKSSKMVHGGIRYLQQGDFRLVYQALSERQRLLRNAPHLVRPLGFLVPIYRRGGLIPRVFARFFGLALWFYDLTGGALIGKRHKRLDKEATLAHMPTLKDDLVQSRYLYDDARADDARLALTVARTAALDHGAAVTNHAPVTKLRKEDGRIVGATVDTDAGTIDVTARAVVNASGVWVDGVDSLEAPQEQPTIRPARGAHVVVRRELVRNDVAVLMGIPGKRASVFAVPWGEFTYIGTSDTDYEGDLDNLPCTADDVSFLLGNINFSTDEELKDDDVLGAWVGLRPLLRGAKRKKTADLSRRHRITRSPGGLISIAGGKLTTYRQMAQDTVDEVLRLLGRQARCRTKSLPLRGTKGHDSVDDGGLGPAVRDHLVSRYGADARLVISLATEDPALAQPLVPGLPYLRAEARYVAEHEMARNLDDVLARRTRARLFARDATAEVAEDVAGLVAGPLGWSDEEQARQVAAYRASVEEEREAIRSPAADVRQRAFGTPEGWVPGVWRPRL